jgi:hypothetical protein
VAEKVGQRSKEVLTLNKPTTLEDLAKGKKVSEKQTDVRTKYDPVSILRPYQKGSDAIEIESTTWNPLAEHKTDTLKRLDEDVMIGRGKLGMMMRGGADATDSEDEDAPPPLQIQPPPPMNEIQQTAWNHLRAITDDMEDWVWGGPQVIPYLQGRYREAGDIVRQLREIGESHPSVDLLYIQMEGIIAEVIDEIEDPQGANTSSESDSEDESDDDDDDDDW